MKEIERRVVGKDSINRRDSTQKQANAAENRADQTEKEGAELESSLASLFLALSLSLYSLEYYMDDILLILFSILYSRSL